MIFYVSLGSCISRLWCFSLHMIFCVSLGSCLSGLWCFVPPHDILCFTRVVSIRIVMFCTVPVTWNCIFHCRLLCLSGLLSCTVPSYWYFMFHWCCFSFFPDCDVLNYSPSWYTPILHHVESECLCCMLRSAVLTHGHAGQRGPDGPMSYVVGLPNNSYTPITNTEWVRARLCKLQKQSGLDSQPQVIKFTSSLHMVGGSLRVLIAESGVKHNKLNNAGQLPGSPTSTVAPSYYMYVVHSIFLMIKKLILLEIPIQKIYV